MNRNVMVILPSTVNYTALTKDYIFKVFLCEETITQPQ